MAKGKDFSLVILGIIAVIAIIGLLFLTQTSSLGKVTTEFKHKLPTRSPIAEQPVYEIPTSPQIAEQPERELPTSPPVPEEELGLVQEEPADDSYQELAHAFSEALILALPMPQEAPEQGCEFASIGRLTKLISLSVPKDVVKGCDILVWRRACRDAKELITIQCKKVCGQFQKQEEGKLLDEYCKGKLSEAITTAFSSKSCKEGYTKPTVQHHYLYPVFESSVSGTTLMVIHTCKVSAFCKCVP